MAINKDLLGPQVEGENEAFAIEALVFSVQLALQKAMMKHGVSNKQLAEKLGMSPARVSQIFASNGPNLTLKTIARIQHALGDEFELVSKSDIETPRPKLAFKRFTIVAFKKPESIWHEIPANGERMSIRAKVA